MEAGNSNAKIRLCDVNFFYGKQQILYDVNAAFDAHALTAIVGPSGQGKSTLLTVINRLWEEIPGARAEGRVDIHFKDSYRNIAAADYPSERLRRRVGMVFQEPNPLPMSIYKNVAFPLKLAKASSKTAATAATSEAVRTALEQGFLWDEVKHRLGDDARKLSGGQQQRLCIARALILSPEILLLDEPTASLDAKAAGVIESLLVSLKPKCTLVMVSHYMEQVERVADRVLEMSHGRLRVPRHHDRG